MQDMNTLYEFVDRWRDHKPALPRFEDPTVNDIRNNLGYLTMKFPFDIPVAAMHAEAKALKESYVYHRAGGNHKGWRSLCLHGLSSVHTESHDRYGFPTREEAPYGWTDISKFCPVTTAFFKDSFGYDWYERVRFMLLEPGGYILPHEDVEHKQLTAINLALNNPEGCRFVMSGWGTVPFQAGTCNMLAIGYEHAVFNDSNEDRYHMIIHGSRGPEWSQYIKNSYLASRDADQ